ncbi:hypothetical protein KGF57_004116, partial [Candida theae]
FEKCVQDILGENSTRAEEQVFSITRFNGTKILDMNYLWTVNANDDNISDEQLKELARCLESYANGIDVNTATNEADCRLVDMVMEHNDNNNIRYKALYRRDYGMELYGHSDTKCKANEIWSDIVNTDGSCHNTNNAQSAIGKSASFTSFGPDGATVQTWNHHDCRKGTAVNTRLRQSKSVGYI